MHGFYHKQQQKSTHFIKKEQTEKFLSPHSFFSPERASCLTRIEKKTQKIDPPFDHIDLIQIEFITKGELPKRKNKKRKRNLACPAICS
mmetsp:Transcript_55790/g.109225  ORF Transcript_55790/g.109225 Transcript_55790/m.109225 type:complete len:89 (-) Transcript_55790:66-332(-)